MSTVLQVRSCSKSQTIKHPEGIVQLADSACTIRSINVCCGEVRHGTIEFGLRQVL